MYIKNNIINKTKYEKNNLLKICSMLILILLIIILGGCAGQPDTAEIKNAEHEQTTDISAEITESLTPTDVPATDSEEVNPLNEKISQYQSSISDIYSQYDENDYLMSDFAEIKELYQDAYDCVAAIKSEDEGQNIVAEFIDEIISFDDKTVTTLERSEDIINNEFLSYDSTAYTAGSYLQMKNIYNTAKDQLETADESAYESIVLDCIATMSDISPSSIEKVITSEEFETRRQEIISALTGKNMTNESITAMLLIFNVDSLADDTFLNYYEPDSTYNDYCIGIEALRIRYRTVMRQTNPDNANYLFSLAQFVFNENDHSAVENMDNVLMECTNGYRETITSNIRDLISYYKGEESSFPVAANTLSDGGNLTILSIGYPFVNSFMGGYGLITEEENMTFYSCVEPYLYENNFLKARYDEIRGNN